MEALEEKSYYDLLGVNRDATEDEIRTSYREIARIFHPDSNFYSEIINDKADEGESDAFKFITAAYNTLIDRERRAAYDQALPPQLREWEAEVAQQGSQILAARPEAAEFHSTVFGLGKSFNPRSPFGNVRPAMRPGQVQTETPMKSVAEMVRERRNPVFWICSLFRRSA